MTSLIEEKVRAYKEIAKKIEELEEQKKSLSKEISELMPQETTLLKVGEYQVRRFARLSIKTSLENARTLEAVKTEEVVDKEKIKSLYQLGYSVPGVLELQYIQVSAAR